MVAVATIAAGMMSISAYAQSRQLSHDFSEFNKVSVTNNFEVSLVKSDRYSIDLTIDDVLHEYVHAYVKSKTLILELDEKAIPKEVRKLYKGRGVEGAVLKAVVYMPVVNGINLEEGAVLSAPGDFPSDGFELNMAGSSILKSLSIESRAGAVINLKKKCTAVLSVSAEKDIEVNTANTSDLSLVQDCVNLVINSKGVTGGTVSASGDANEIKVNADGSAKVTLTGKTDKLAVDGKGAANIDALNLKTPVCSAVLREAAKLTEAATENLSIDIAGASSVVFDESPVFEIIQVKNSSVLKYAASDKK